jgi:hypothetical protein
MMGRKKVADVYETRKVGEIHKKTSSGWIFWVIVIVVVLVLISD